MSSISIVIPVFNKKRTLVRAVVSAVEQRVEQGYHEVVIVDDGSTDGGVESLPDHLLACIKVVRQPNAGVSVARNVGVRESSSDLVMFLDADDELLPGSAQAFINLSRCYGGASFYSGAHEKVSEYGDIFLPKGAWSPKKEGLIADFYREYRVNAGLVNSSSVCVRKKVFQEVGGFPVGERLGEDVYLWIMLAMHGELAHTGRVISRVYRNAQNRSAASNISNNAPPYFVKCFLMEDQGKALYRHQPGLRKLIFRLALWNALEAKETGAYGRVKSICKCYRSEPMQWAVLSIAKIIPARWIRRLRRVKSALLVRATAIRTIKNRSEEL
ncbi:MAG: glycosyltransferase family A protein [Aquisalimonadaceae bacterium]